MPKRPSCIFFQKMANLTHVTQNAQPHEMRPNLNCLFSIILNVKHKILKENRISYKPILCITKC